MSTKLARKETALDIDRLEDKARAIKVVGWIYLLPSRLRSILQPVLFTPYAIVVSVLLVAVSACGGASSEAHQPDFAPDIVPPTANAGQDIVVAGVGSVVHLSGRYSYNGSESIESYHWRACADNSVEVFIDGANSEEAAFFSPSVQKDTQLTFFLEVTDPAGNRGRDRVVVTILADPVLSPLPLVPPAEREIAALLAAQKPWQRTGRRN